MSSSLEGRVALITGGARGQGRSHALHLAALGADIVICDIAADVDTNPYPLATPADLAETVDLVTGLGRRCLSRVVDVRNATAINDLVADAVTEFGRLDILVANAGVCPFAPFEEITDQAWRDTIDINLTGAFNSMRAVIAPMREGGYGRIVATSSMGGRSGVPNLAHYVATKWGVIGLVKTLALETATSGITVNAVCPNTVNTPMVHNPALYGLFAPDMDNPTMEEVRPRYETMNPMGLAWLEPEEISAAVGFLVSEGARHISGSTIEVSAGASALMP